MSMMKYLIRRLISMIPVVLGVMTLTFVLSRMMPGDPVLAFMPEGRPDPDLYVFYYHLLSEEWLVIPHWEWLQERLVTLLLR